MTPTITCPRCLMTSANPNDIANAYCGNCHMFYEDMIGELHTTFLFSEPAQAKLAWEKIEARCREIAVYRWHWPDELVELLHMPAVQAITVLTEVSPQQRQSFEKARVLARRGNETATPPMALLVFRQRRTELLLAGGHRVRFRSPGGYGLDIQGRPTGPERRPQG